MSYGKICLVGNDVPRFLGELDNGGTAGSLADILEELINRRFFTLHLALDLDNFSSACDKKRYLR
ncbi:hypothetical protein BM221_008339 [Beauveria bassiana]|uniref:Uncharacterized protein n=1 Tax=Beauveria bassiana TaxID=176275 RepID=A0A2N6NFS0_BEABA|nr:hypothetical protein BM221_008339 [Beauveria bassiana]